MAERQSAAAEAFLLQVPLYIHPMYEWYRRGWKDAENEVIGRTWGAGRNNHPWQQS